MRRKFSWVVLSCLIAAALVLSSCNAATVEEKEMVVVEGKITEEAAPEVAEKEEVKGEEKGEIALGPEVPRYGGELTIAWSTDPVGFCQMQTYHYNLQHMSNIYDQLFIGDWAKGPAGTNEYEFLTGAEIPEEYRAGSLATSWEVVDPTTFVIEIRKGVRFQNKPPVNGRELVAADYVWSLEQCMASPKSVWYGTTTPYPVNTVKTLDKYTVEVTIPEPNFETLVYLGEAVYVMPHEVIDVYGEEGLYDWKNSCGTGPYFLTDYVKGSSMKYDRNPDFWDYDPLHPENQLPYIDSLVTLIIPDTSTMLAALRSGKIDIQYNISYEDSVQLAKTNPEINQKRRLRHNNNLFAPKVDRPPFDDLRVRRAAMMAINHQAIVDEFFNGEAELVAWPTTPDQVSEYVPFSELPKSSQELFEYNPEEAKRLMTEAGYKDGFEIEILAYDSASYRWVDLGSLIKEYWAAINIDLTLDVKEYGVWNAQRRALNFEMVTQGYGTPGSVLRTLPAFVTGHIYNRYGISDPYIDEMNGKVRAEYDPDKRNEMFRELNTYIIDQSFMTVTPMPYVYNCWQPWVLNYHGEHGLGWDIIPNQFRYLWLDQ